MGWEAYVFRITLFSQKSTDSLFQPQHTLPPFQRRSTDHSQPRSDSFGNFLRCLAFALASTFTYDFGF